MSSYPVKKLGVIHVLAFFLLIASGCGTATQVPVTLVQPQGSVTQTADSGSPSSTPAPTPGGSQNQAANVTLHLELGSGPFDLPDPRVGLSDLPSYSATLTVNFVGTNNNQPVKWSRTYAMLASKTPAVRQLTVQTSGDVSDKDQRYLAEMDGVDYEQLAQNPCTAAVIDPGNSLSARLEPARFLSFVLGADAAGSGPVNAVPANHYTFDERALGQKNLTKSTGELWVASSGGYLVRYVLTTNAASDYFGAGVAGALSEDYELTGVGKLVNIHLPDGCPGGMISIPALPDAKNEINSPGGMTYDTSASLADAAAYYEKQAAGAGWAKGSDPDVSPTSVLMEYSLGDQTMSITLTTNAGVTTVNIFVIRGQPAPAAPSSPNPGLPIPLPTGSIPPFPGIPLPTGGIPPLPIPIPTP